MILFFFFLRILLHKLQNSKKCNVWKPEKRFSPLHSPRIVTMAHQRGPNMPLKQVFWSFWGIFSPYWRAIVTILGQCKRENLFSGFQTLHFFEFLQKYAVKSLEKCHFWVLGYFPISRTPKCIGKDTIKSLRLPMGQ